LGFALLQQYDKKSLLMNIEGIIWLRTVIDKLAFKHHVEIHEVEEVFAREQSSGMWKKESTKARMFTWLLGKRMPADT
jgi:hypothetical protein